MDSMVKKFEQICKFFVQVDASLAVLFVLDCNLFGLGTILYHGYCISKSLAYWTVFTLLFLVGVICDIHFPATLEDDSYYFTTHITGGFFLAKGMVFMELKNTKRITCNKEC